MNCSDNESITPLSQDAQQVVDASNRRADLYLETVVRRDSEIASLHRIIRELQEQLHPRTSSTTG